MRFAQVKIVARDVASLTRWYVEVLGCDTVMAPAELDDPMLCRAMGAQSGSLVTLSMVRPPGQDDDGAIIEFYSLSPQQTDWPFRAGGGQVAFEVDDIDGLVGRILTSGGGLHGEVVDWVAPSGRRSRFVYANDPEGNIVDLFAPTG